MDESSVLIQVSWQLLADVRLYLNLGDQWPGGAGWGGGGG